MKRAILSGLAVPTIVALAGPAAAQYKATMKLALALALDHPYMLGGQKFADLIKERTNGRIQITLYPSGQLGKGEREMCEGVQTEPLICSSPLPVRWAVSAPPSISWTSPSCSAISPTWTWSWTAPSGRKLLNDFEKVEYRGVRRLRKRVPPLTNAKRQVRRVEDAKGSRSAPWNRCTSRPGNCGVNPTPIGLGEVFTALQQCIDGQENRSPSSTAPSCRTPGRRTLSPLLACSTLRPRS